MTKRKRPTRKRAKAKPLTIKQLAREAARAGATVTIKLAPAPTHIASRIHEQLKHIVDALPYGETVEGWYWAGGMSSDLVGQPDGPETKPEIICYALGYLRGIADTLEVTLLELLKIEASRDAAIGALMERAGGDVPGATAGSTETKE